MTAHPTFKHYLVTVKYMHNGHRCRTEQLEIITTHLQALMDMRRLHEKFMRLLPEVLDAEILKSN